MPFKSQAQQKFLYSQLPAIAKEMQSKTKPGTKLPKKLGKGESLPPGVKQLQIGGGHGLRKKPLPFHKPNHGQSKKFAGFAKMMLDKKIASKNVKNHSNK